VRIPGRSVGYTAHARDMLIERAIPEELVIGTIDGPDSTEEPGDGNVHYLRAIPERDSRTLRVVVNQQKTPWLVVTVFFDRRIRRLK